MFEPVFQRDSTGIHLGTNQHSAVGEDSYTPVVFLTQFVQKGCYTGVKVSERFSACGRLVQEIVVPKLQPFVDDVVETLHLPVAHIHFFQPSVPFSIGITAECGQFGRTAERTGVHVVESEAAQPQPGGSGFAPECGTEGNVRKTVASAAWDVY